MVAVKQGVIAGGTQGGLGGSGESPFKLMKFIAWLGIHVEKSKLFIKIPGKKI